MNKVEIRFNDEGRDGIVPVGTYLIDAAKRMGVPNLADCAEIGSHECFFIIEEGFELLSEITSSEAEHLAESTRNDRTRLACFAKIEKPGVIVAMSKEKTTNESKDAKPVDKDEQYRKEFAELPLEKKISNLVQLEAIALSETVAYVINSPFAIADKIGDVLAEFGFKKEENEKRKKRPVKEDEKGEPVKGKARPARKAKGSQAVPKSP